jgi:H+/Cl- antiporter ClcA
MVCEAAAGSGLPEFKSLLANEMKLSETGKLVSTRILLTKMSGLIFAVGSCLSVGSEGPLVHISACMAYILMKYIPEFGDIYDSPSASKQIFATAAAVGLGSAFNSPVGGLLFSVEVTATYYLISNYWKSFIAAVAGAVACNVFLMTRNGMSGDPVTVLTMETVSHPFVVAELLAFLVIGISFGYLAHYYLRAHQYVFLFLKPYNLKYPIAVAAVVGGFSAFIIYFTGMYSEKSVGVIANVEDVLTTASVSSLHLVGPARLGGLLVAAVIRAALTLIGRRHFWQYIL